MKLYGIFLVILVTSGMLFLPLMKPATEIQLFPSTPELVMMNIQSPRIHVMSEVDGAPVTMNISRYNAQTDERIPFKNVQFTDVEVDIDLGSSGYYLIRFQTPSIDIVTITEEGLSDFTVVYAIIMGGLAIALFIYRRYFKIPEY